MDDRFFFNSFLLQELLQFRQQLPDPSSLDSQGILVALLQGFVGIYHLRETQICLLSRLSQKRAGVRFMTRGIDDEGNVANFVETELLLKLKDGTMHSYLTLRGSVPCFWEQQGFQVAGHKIQITKSTEATLPAFQLHFTQLMQNYGNIRCLNLLSSQQVAEQSLSTEYRNLIQSLQSDALEYIEFDYNLMTKQNSLASQQFVQREDPEIPSFLDPNGQMRAQNRSFLGASKRFAIDSSQ